jgi:spermidine synthase
MKPKAPLAAPPPGPAILSLLPLFFASGCAALIYEIVWFQQLQLVIGSTAVSMAVLLATFMGGMCAGSLLLPRLVSPSRHPLRVYACLEAGIGLSAILVLFLMPYVDRAYVAHAAGGRGIALRAVLSVVCLTPPTLLMGATLPAISRWLDTTPRGVGRLSLLYSCNTLGAVFGAGLAGFYLLRIYDLATATYVAIAINAAIAVASAALSLTTPHPTALPIRAINNQRLSRAKIVFIIIALSGMSALGGEVVWTRLVSLALGPTVYTFSMIVAVFLAGLGIGSAAGAALARRTRRPLVWLGISQCLLSAAICWTAYASSLSIPYWHIDNSMTPWQRILDFDLIRCVYAILPGPLLWGMSFPLALAAAAEDGGEPGRMVAGIYAANTLGAIAGAIGFSLFLIPWCGTRQSQCLMIALCLLATALALGRRKMSPRRSVLLLLCLAGGAALTRILPGIPWQVLAAGRLATQFPVGVEPLFVGEGINSSIAVTQSPDGTTIFHVAGKVEASTGVVDMRLQRMLGDLPALIHPQPQSVLIVGCGAGVTAGTFVIQPGVRHIVICELEPLVPRVAAKYFWAQNFDVVNDPRVRIVYDDARHFIMTTREKFDIITSDPINPWVKGAATLYTQEYFELCRRHLNPGGCVTQWVPLYETSEQAVKSEFATFFQVFPDSTVWSNPHLDGTGHDVVLLGRPDAAAPIDVDAIQRRLAQPQFDKVSASLRELGIMSAVDLLATYAGQGRDLAQWLADAQMNRDGNLRLEYLAALGRDNHDNDLIYRDFLRYYRFPDRLFVATPSTQTQLKAAMLREVGNQKPAP